LIKEFARSEKFPRIIRKGRKLSPAIKEIEERRRANEDVLALFECIKCSKRGFAQALNE
jgi:hypothetical protein